MSYLLYTMLQSVNIPSYMALSSTRGHRYDLNFPSISSANHVICLAQFEGQDYYLDATDNACPLGLPSQHIQDRQIFICSDTGSFNAIPLIEATTNLDKLDIVLTEKNEDFFGTLTETKFGMAASESISIRKNFSNNKFDFINKKILKNKYPTFHTDSIRYHSSNTDLYPKIEYRATCSPQADITSKIGKNYYLNLDFLPKNDFFAILKAEWNDTILYIPHSFKNEYLIKLAFENNVEMITPKKIKVEESKNLWFSFECSQSNANSFLIHYIYYCNYSSFNQERIEELQSLQNKIDQKSIFTNALKYYVKN